MSRVVAYLILGLLMLPSVAFLAALTFFYPLDMLAMGALVVLLWWIGGLIMRAEGAARVAPRE